MPSRESLAHEKALEDRAKQEAQGRGLIVSKVHKKPDKDGNVKGIDMVTFNQTTRNYTVIQTYGDPISISVMEGLELGQMPHEWWPVRTA